jgi:hypothetical protein
VACYVLGLRLPSVSVYSYVRGQSVDSFHVVPEVPVKAQAIHQCSGFRDKACISVHVKDGINCLLHAWVPQATLKDAVCKCQTIAFHAPPSSGMCMNSPHAANYFFYRPVFGKTATPVTCVSDRKQCNSVTHNVGDYKA